MGEISGDLLEVKRQNRGILFKIVNSALNQWLSSFGHLGPLYTLKIEDPKGSFCLCGLYIDIYKNRN